MFLHVFVVLKLLSIVDLQFFVLRVSLCDFLFPFLHPRELEPSASLNSVSRMSSHLFNFQCFSFMRYFLLIVSKYSGRKTKSTNLLFHIFYISAQRGLFSLCVSWLKSFFASCISIRGHPFSILCFSHALNQQSFQKLRSSFERPR